jgi:hypothetical protein
MSILTAAGITFGDSTSQTTAAVTGVTSLVAGNGITVSGATGAVTVSLNYYTGSTVNNTTFPVGSYIAATDPGNIWTNATTPPYVQTTGNNNTFQGYNPGAGWTALAGTWRSRGHCADFPPCGSPFMILQRTA